MGQLTGRRVISNQIGSRRLHVGNGTSSRPWKNDGERNSKTDTGDKRLKDESG